MYASSQLPLDPEDVVYKIVYRVLRAVEELTAQRPSTSSHPLQEGDDRRCRGVTPLCPR